MQLTLTLRRNIGDCQLVDYIYVRLRLLSVVGYVPERCRYSTTLLYSKHRHTANDIKVDTGCSLQVCNRPSKSTTKMSIISYFTQSEKDWRR